MFLGKYEFAGDPTELAAAYDRFMSEVPSDAIGFHICITHDAGITIFDTCPTEEVFAATASDPDFLAAMTLSGLPDPVVTRLGQAHVARASATLVT